MRSIFMGKCSKTIKTRRRMSLIHTIYRSCGFIDQTRLSTSSIPSFSGIYFNKTLVHLESDGATILLSPSISNFLSSSPFHLQITFLFLTLPPSPLSTAFFVSLAHFHYLFISLPVSKKNSHSVSFSLFSLLRSNSKQKYRMFRFYYWASVHEKQHFIS